MAKHSCEGGGDFTFTGALGTFLFCILILIAFSGFLRTPRAAGGKWFTAKQNYFLAVLVMATLDLPRYLIVAMDNEYGCSRKTWIYALHMLANAFFFSSYSIICSLWQETVAGGRKITLFTRPVLVTFNGIFFFFSLFGVWVCVHQETIFDFFETTFYAVYTVLTACKNLFFFAAISWSGFQILLPLYMVRCGSGLEENDENVPNLAAHLKPIIFKIKVLVVVVSISGLLRFIMLCIKISILDSTSSSYWFTSPAWWVFDDFVPRLLPTAGFMLLMFGSVLVRHKSQVVQPVPDIDPNDHSQLEFSIEGNFHDSKENFEPHHEDNDSFISEDYSSLPSLPHM
mmetsp:Transcript_31609/g.44014  ORF Transcript_31609/g.44014 Transcript_31609/m.44014 type:complete len:342 (+) Transcript_31609:71-1096(+)